MIRDFGRAFVIVLALLILIAEVERLDSQQTYAQEQ
jgi:hypothetical protein